MMYKGYKPGKPEDSKATPVYFTETELPAAVDWRTKGYVTPVKWQVTHTIKSTKLIAVEDFYWSTLKMYHYLMACNPIRKFGVS